MKEAAAPLLSIVSPVYRAEEIVGELVRRLAAAAEKVTPDYEIILVDDASPDAAWERIEEACRGNGKVKGLRLSRNFGQHPAITAGIARAAGEFVVVIDCDLQDDPDDIPVLVAKAREGFDVVLTRRRERVHSRLRNIAARVFFRLYNSLTDSQLMDAEVGGYSLITRKVARAYLQIRDVHRHHLMILGWMGFRRAFVDVTHGPRYAGRSSYSFPRLVAHALDGLTSQSTKLLKFSIGLGVAYCVTALLVGVGLIVGYVLHGYMTGWFSIVVLLLASTGIILISVGIAGIYVGNIFDQVRFRPLYLVKDTMNLDERPEGRSTLGQ